MRKYPSFHPWNKTIFNKKKYKLRSFFIQINTVCVGVVERDGKSDGLQRWNPRGKYDNEIFKKKIFHTSSSQHF